MNLTIAAHKATWARLAALIGIATALSAFAGWQAGQPVVPPTPLPAPTPWELPRQKSEDSARDLRILTTRLPWDGGPLKAVAAISAPGRPGARGTPASSKPSNEWRLAGIVQRSDENFVILAIGPPNALKFEYRQVGNKLPDGSVLIEITADRAVTRRGTSLTERQTYSLFHRKQ